MKTIWQGLFLCILYASNVAPGHAQEAPQSNSVVTEFNDIALDGEGSTPFIRFDNTGQSSKFFVSFNDNFGLWTGNSYSVRFYSSAPSNALTLDNIGAHMKNEVHITDDDNIVDLKLDHTTTSQTFGVTSLNSNSGLHGGGIGFNTQNASFPFYVFNTANNATLALTEKGVSIGHYEAQAALHILANGSPLDTAKMIIENATPVQDEQELLILKNKGGSKIRFQDSDSQVGWWIGNAINGTMRIGRSDGSTGLVYVNSELEVLSDRDRKMNFEPVDYSDILSKVANLPISTYQFKDADTSVHHLGPVAQDFHSIFGLGNSSKSIAPMDAVGIALASVQGLQKELVQHFPLI